MLNNAAKVYQKAPPPVKPERPICGIPRVYVRRGSGVTLKRDLLPPEGPGQRYRARFICQARGPIQGEWAANGPYFLDRDATQRVALEAGDDGRAEFTLPLNARPNLPISDRQAQVQAFLPGRMLLGTLSIDNTQGGEP
jgi:hypothetical protein